MATTNVSGVSGVTPASGDPEDYKKFSIATLMFQVFNQKNDNYETDLNARTDAYRKIGNMMDQSTQLRDFTNRFVRVDTPAGTGANSDPKYVSTLRDPDGRINQTNLRAFTELGVKNYNDLKDLIASLPKENGNDSPLAAKAKSVLNDLGLVLYKGGDPSKGLRGGEDIVDCSQYYLGSSPPTSGTGFFADFNPPKVVKTITYSDTKQSFDALMTVTTSANTRATTEMQVCTSQFNTAIGSLTSINNQLVATMGKLTKSIQ